MHLTKKREENMKYIPNKPFIYSFSLFSFCNMKVSFRRILHDYETYQVFLLVVGRLDQNICKKKDADGTR